MTQAETWASGPPPHQGTPRRRTPGRLAGKVWIADDFDETPEDIIASFEGGLEAGSDPLTGS